MDDDYNVRVADFGLSRVKQDLNTMTGGLGTFQWMAPEVWTGIKPSCAGSYITTFILAYSPALTLYTSFASLQVLISYMSTAQF